MKYFAHSDPEGRPCDDPSATWQPLREHLVQVGLSAEQFARDAGASEALARRARALGLLHDFGKYTRNFQKLIRGEVKKAPHSDFGAAAAFFHGGRASDLAFAIAGHHGGIPDNIRLRERLAKVRGEIESLLEIAAGDCPELGELFRSPKAYSGAQAGDYRRVECATRILFSCLIDADRIDTAKHGGQEIAPAALLEATDRLKGVLKMADQRARAITDGPVKSARARVLDACLNAAGRRGPLFSLTVPTGGAKTLASMAFALRRAELFPENVRRVIVVIPFLSIIEQNAKVYREALGSEAVLEHHSGIWRKDDEEEENYSHPAQRLAIENWNSPIVVTTSVRFFEALFSNRPKDLRRMHNIARSVVILDEVQTLPRGRVSPILSMMRSLAEDWETTFVFCTATQPAFEKRSDAKDDPRWSAGTLDEIMPCPKDLFGALKRVEVTWPERDERKTWSALAAEVAEERQALIIVNTRDHALKLYREVARDCPQALHLSNNMCPAHRSKRLAEIRCRLNRGEDCLVVSTQLVEAGVDLDFPAVWRSMGPLDSIAQAAGRCDREGRLTMDLGRPGGRVVVFQPKEDQMPPGDYLEAASITKSLAAEGGISIDDPDAILAYFHRYYDRQALDSDKIEDLRRGFDYKTVADSFQMIEDNSWSVIVPYEDCTEQMLKQVSFGALGVLRQLQQYTVNLWERDFRKGVALGAIYQVRADKDIWAARPGFYDTDVGLRVEPQAGQMVM